MARESREIWAQRVRDWIDSGLTCAQYAAKAGVNERTLSNWRGRLRRAAQRGGGSVRRGGKRSRHATERCETSHFVELSAVGGQDSRLELELPNRCRLRMSERFDAQAVSSLLELLLHQVPS